MIVCLKRWHLSLTKPLLHSDMLENSAEYQNCPYFELPNTSPSYANCDEYLAGLRNNEWGNYTTLLCAARLFQLTIQVYSAYNGGTKLVDVGSGTRIIKIAHLYEYHFAAIKRPNNEASLRDYATLRVTNNNGEEDGKPE
jgi:hypothetical protein